MNNATKMTDVDLYFPASNELLLSHPGGRVDFKMSSVRSSTEIENLCIYQMNKRERSIRMKNDPEMRRAMKLRK